MGTLSRGGRLYPGPIVTQTRIKKVEATRFDIVTDYGARKNDLASNPKIVVSKGRVTVSPTLMNLR